MIRVCTCFYLTNPLCQMFPFSFLAKLLSYLFALTVGNSSHKLQLNKSQYDTGKGYQGACGISILGSVQDLDKKTATADPILCCQQSCIDWKFV